MSNFFDRPMPPDQNGLTLSEAERNTLLIMKDQEIKELEDRISHMKDERLLMRCKFTTYQENKVAMDKRISTLQAELHACDKAFSECNIENASLKKIRTELVEAANSMKFELRSVSEDRKVLIQQIENMKKDRQGLLNKLDHGEDVITKLNKKIASKAMREVEAAQVKEVNLNITTETEPNGKRYVRVRCGGEGVTFLL